MIKTVHVSHVGRVRPVNEDSVFVRNMEHGYTLGVVADGMGGHQAGDTASRLAVDTVAEDLSSLIRHVDGRRSRRARRCDTACERGHIPGGCFRRASAQYGDDDCRGAVPGNEGYIGHIGDSRAYKVAPEQVIRLTEDHTLVNELYKSGQITEDELETHPRRNVLSRALGTDIDVSVELTPVSLGDGEVLLLCSDGLSNRVSRERIGQIAGALDIPLEERADRLLQLALLAGGEDNITVAMFEHQEEAAGQRIKGGIHDRT